MYKDMNKSFEERVEDLVSRLSLEEKVSQLVFNASAISSLGIPEYNWWNEGLHGVARAGVATVFPQAIGVAATFNDELVNKMAIAISDEGRAKHHEFARKGDRGIYKGLTFWSPNINIFRDPRWGRGQETYGEDPYLTGRLGVAFVKGMQGDHPKYLKTIATPKHYAVHSGPEAIRHEFDAKSSVKDMYETYLPAFKECIKEGRAYSIMGAYNRVNGEPCCASPTLLQEILREEWGFEGFVVSDCGAIEDIYDPHRVVSSPEEAAALALKNGCDLCCGSVFKLLLEAFEQELISEEDIDRSVKRLFMARFKLGMFDPEDEVPYAQIPYEVNNCEEHIQLALDIARESIVLLKNEDDLLPLNKDVDTIAVIGPNTSSKDVLIGNYSGVPSEYITVLHGIRRKVSPNTKVIYAEGCELSDTSEGDWGSTPTQGFAEAIAAAERSDVVVMCLGISPALEGEEGEIAESDGGGDRTDLNLPGVQEELLKVIYKLGKPVVLVILNGSPLSINWAHENIPAIVEAWYPGEQGGNAVADVLFGDYNPAGRLPVTFIKSLDDIPPFSDYRMEGRTYRYMKKEPLYPFGYGLSYTHFEYSNLQLNAGSIGVGDGITARVEVQNIGPIAGDEVVQLYIDDIEASVEVPIWELKGMKRIHLKPLEKTTVEFNIVPRQMALIDKQGRCLIEPGMFKLYIGGQQPDARSEALTGKKVLSHEFEVKGERLEIEY